MKWPILASSDTFDLTVTGSQTHGAIPWAGVDPIVLGAQVVLGFQTIVSRQIDLTRQPALDKMNGVSVTEVPKATPSEDFSFFAQEVPGLYVMIGASEDPASAAPNHSPDFQLDEDSLLIGVRTLLNLALYYQETNV